LRNGGVSLKNNNSNSN